MYKRVMFLLLIAALCFGCQQKAKVSDQPLTAADSLNLQLVSKDYVISFAAPPMMPVDHPVDLGEDINHTQNGGQACLECHNDQDQAEEDVVQTLHPERHNCMQCHIQVMEETASNEDFRMENTFIKYQPM